MIKAVIFDMDGTLIDTEKYYKVAWRYALEHFGYHPTDAQLLNFRSLGRPFSSAYLKSEFGDELEYQKVREVRQKKFNELVEQEGIQLKPGAKEILEFLRERGIVTAVATSTNIQRANAYLQQIGLYDLLDRVVRVLWDNPTIAPIAVRGRVLVTRAAELASKNGVVVVVEL